MITAFIVLLVIALALGGYIAFDILRVKKNNAVAAESLADALTVVDKNIDSTIDETVIEDEIAQSGAVFNPSDIRQSVTVQEADALIKDEVAASLIEKSGGKSDRTNIGFVNIDTLSQYFESGETVTLKEVINRIPAVSDKTSYLKVLARGRLDKPLIVEADNFSLQAVKMIVVTGGKAIKK